MKKSALISAIAMLVFFASGKLSWAQGNQPAMAKLCSFCHQAEPRVMMGFLDKVSLDSKVIQMDFMSHKDVVHFNDQTSVKYLKSFADIANYPGKGFRIEFQEKNGKKIANRITRFDILKVVQPNEKIDMAEFKRLRQQENTKVFDVRPPMVYKRAHVPGSDLLPAPAFDKFAHKLPKDKDTPIIFYCVGGCLSPTASLKTKALGYSNVKIFTGGYPEWAKTEYGEVSPDWLKMAISKKTPYVLIDLRTNAEIEKGHIPGAVSMQLETFTQKKTMFPVDKKAPLVFFGPGMKDAASQAVSWGYKKVQILPVSIEAWQQAGNPIVTGKAQDKVTYEPKPKPGTISAEDFTKVANNKPSSKQIIDVRNPDEYNAGFVKGSLNIPLDEIVQI